VAERNATEPRIARPELQSSVNSHGARVSRVRQGKSAGARRAVTLQWQSSISLHRVSMVRRPVFLRLTLVAALAAAAVAAQAQSPGEISARARTAMEAAFARTDANGDGRLTPDEAEHMPAIAMLFVQLDRNKDGFLSLEEFSVGYLGRAEAADDQLLSRASFSLFQ
jgi:hypothetical protein